MLMYLQQQKQYLLLFFLVAFFLLLLAPVLQAQSLAVPTTDSSWPLPQRADQSERLFLPLVLRVDDWALRTIDPALQAEPMVITDLPPDTASARGNLLATRTPTRVPPLRPTNTPTPMPTPTLAVTPPPPVAAVPLIPTPSQPFTLTWEARVSFDATQTTGIIAHWVMKRTDVGGASQIVEKVDISQSCTRVGNVAIAGTQALFTGGYIACPLPDFQVHVVAYTQQRQECLCLLNQTTPPWVAAQFTVTGTNTIHPLAYLDNELRYTVHSDTSGGYTNLAFAGGGAIESHHPSFHNHNIIAFTGYNPRTILPNLELGPAGAHAFLNNQDFISAVSQTAPTSFLAWLSTPLHNITPAPAANPTLSPTWLYIGGSPSIGDRFMGMVKQVNVDPGCISTN